MINGIYTIFDRVAGANQLICAPSDLMAKRMFADAFHANNSFIAKHADDFVLMKIGTIDTETCEIMPIIDEICEATDFIKTEKTDEKEDKNEN